ARVSHRRGHRRRIRGAGLRGLAPRRGRRRARRPPRGVRRSSRDGVRVHRPAALCGGRGRHRRPDRRAGGVRAQEAVPRRAGGAHPAGGDAGRRGRVPGEHAHAARVGVPRPAGPGGHPEERPRPRAGGPQHHAHHRPGDGLPSGRARPGREGSAWLAGAHRADGAADRAGRMVLGGAARPLRLPALDGRRRHAGLRDGVRLRFARRPPGHRGGGQAAAAPLQRGRLPKPGHPAPPLPERLHRQGPHRPVVRGGRCRAPVHRGHGVRSARGLRRKRAGGRGDPGHADRRRGALRDREVPRVGRPYPARGPYDGADRRLGAVRPRLAQHLRARQAHQHRGGGAGAGARRAPVHLHGHHLRERGQGDHGLHAGGHAHGQGHLPAPVRRHRGGRHGLRAGQRAGEAVRGRVPHAVQRAGNVDVPGAAARRGGLREGRLLRFGAERPDRGDRRGRAKRHEEVPPDARQPLGRHGRRPHRRHPGQRQGSPPGPRRARRRHLLLPAAGGHAQRRLRGRLHPLARAPLRAGGRQRDDPLRGKRARRGGHVGIRPLRPRSALRAPL
ncbi:MAG: hypothetical protein AVDCRST_MAG68-2418, partial [uncultured Gemmatimonadetes bacterium]